jgi:RNA polymerase sigma-70 factor (ECF subfamily)
MIMSSAGTRTLQQDLEAIFGAGTLSALSDGQLLAQFLEGRDPAGEQAFESIVKRHGSMVYRVCCQVMGDGHEAQDAFQAVFLVLARRADAVRNRESLGSWLYGVALRVSARARAGVQRRRGRELQSDGEFEDLKVPETPEGESCSDSAEVVHQEVGRLPEKNRAPIVLCYLEGLTHDQAAARLKWPVGTVRSRLARGRDQLRGRLVRRGVTAPATLGPLAGWLMAGSATTAEAASIAPMALSTVPAELLASTVRSACQFAQGKSAVALFSAGSLLLTKGVLRSMAFEKLILIACSVLPTGTLAIASGVMIGQSSAPTNGSVSPAGTFQEPRKADPATARSTTTAQDPAEQERLEEAREARALLMKVDLQEAESHFQSEWKRYREGRIGLDPLLKRAAELKIFDQNAATGSLIEPAERHLNRLKEIEAFEQNEIKAGRGTQLDLQAVQREIEAAKMEVKVAREFKQPKIPDLVEAARQRLEAQKAYYEEGRITLDRFIAASQRLMEAEHLAAKTDAERLAALKRHVGLLKEVENRERAELVIGKGTQADVAEAVQSRVEAEIQLEDAATSSKAEIEALARRLGEVERKLDQILKRLPER